MVAGYRDPLDIRRGYVARWRRHRGRRGGHGFAEHRSKGNLLKICTVMMCDSIKEEEGISQQAGVKAVQAWDGSEAGGEMDG